MAFGSLLAITLAFGFSVWFSTTQHVRAQIGSDLTVAGSVIGQLLQSREQQLTASAEVLTTDFGFKQAVATQDASTIKSVLLNHGARIGADLMMLVSLDGALIASNLSERPGSRRSTALQSALLVEQVLDNGPMTRLIHTNNRLYQTILLPIRAPVAIAVAMVGFEMDQALADELKALTLQDVTFLISEGEGLSHAVSTVPAEQVADIVSSAGQAGQAIELSFFKRSGYVSQAFELDQPHSDPIHVYLSASVDEAFRNFNVLQWEIIAIALIASVLAFIGSILAARHLAAPLSRLATTASDIASGDYRQEVKERSGIMEIQALASAFNSMQVDLAEREARIVHQAQHDPLTNLFNRQYIVTLLQEALNEAGTQPLAVMGLNILDFREVNDTFGHVVGDQCLQEIGARLMDLSLQTGVAARLGGDEFMVVLPVKGSVQETVKQLLKVLSQPCVLHSLEISLRFSVGVARVPEDSLDAADLMKKADIALDMARHDHREMAIYEPALEEAHLKRLTLLADLKAALISDDGQLRMYYQPKLNANNLEASRFEALIRWVHPEQGFVPPDLFIPFAEQAGLIGAITDWVVEAVITQIDRWQQQGFDAQVAINLSARDLSRPHLLELINRLLVRHQLPAHSIAFEITESEVMKDPQEARQLLCKFREQGFELSIDDFGTGYSSLSQLKHMPVTELKIDKSFVLQLAQLEDDQIIVQSTIHLAHSFNLKVVAEGVEDQASLDLLQQWGCDWIQGFYLSKPLPADQVLPWIRDYRGRDAGTGQSQHQSGL